MSQPVPVEQFFVSLVDQVLSEPIYLVANSRQELGTLLLKLAEPDLQVRYQVADIEPLPVFTSCREFMRETGWNNDLNFGSSL